MMTVDMKSSTESTRDANTDKEDEVKATNILATSRNTFARKLMKTATATIRSGLYSVRWSGNRNDSSSKEGRPEGGPDRNPDGRR